MRRLIFFLFALTVSRAGAETPKTIEVVRELIPKNAKKVTMSSRDPSAALNKYYDAESEDLIAVEEVQKSQTVKITFFKGGTKVGTETEWYLSGKTKSDIPFRDGVMDGICRHWAENGDLIGCYKMSKGNGVRKVYYPNGRLREEIHMENGVIEGLDLLLHDNGQVRVINHRKKNRFTGTSPSFYVSGHLRFIGSCDDNEQPNGPAIDFDENGNQVGKTSFFIAGKELTETKYSEEKEKSPSLPTWATADEAKKWVHENFDAIIAEYKALPLVKIPLDDIKQ